MFNFINLSVGKGNFENRKEWIKKTLEKIPDDGKILDAGAGESQYKDFCSHLKYVSQDFNQYDGTGDKKGLQTGDYNYSKIDIVSDITEIPVEDNSFDAVMCTEVLEHVPNPVEAINELSRVLKKDGFLIMTAPFCSLTHFSPYHFSTGFSKYYYENYLDALDFEILEIESNGNYFEYLAQELRRVNSIAKKYSNISIFKQTILKIFTAPLLFLLGLFSKKDSGSEELLCFGYHVLAKKK